MELKQKTGVNLGLYALFALAALATVTMWTRDPFPAWGYAFGVLALAIRICLKGQVRGGIGEIALGVISLWGFGQLAAGTSAYSWATWNASLGFAGLGATALISEDAFAWERLRMAALRGFVWFAFAVTLASALAHYSIGQASDAWGPFLNRNHFAVFLELALPVALWLSPVEPIYIGIAASFLAAGVASASRAGAALLVLETVVVGILLPGWRRAFPRFAWLCAVFLLVTGASHLAGRLGERDPFRYRREIAHSALAMVAEHPWRGFGVGTFQTAYPAYAEFDAGKTVDHAHNDWLEWAAEGGAPFAFAWAVLLIRLVRPAIRSVWGVGVLSVFVHATVDYPFARVGLGAWVFLLIGGLLSEKRRRTSGPPGGRPQEKAALGLETVRAVVAGGMALIMAAPVMAASATAASGTVGTVTAAGSFRVNHSMIHGNATLFEGSLVETNTAISSLELSGGSVRLAAFSEARVFGDRLRLEKGAGEIGHANGIRRGTGFRMEARGLIVEPVMDGGEARVTLGDGKRVTVAVFSGGFRVFNTTLNAAGGLIARVAPGSVLEFEPQPSVTPSRVTGCLTNRRGHFLITDETTNVVVEVAGTDLQKEQGNRVEITGTSDATTTPVSDAAQYIRVTSVKRLSKGCGKTSAAPAGSDRVPPGKAAPGGNTGGNTGGTTGGTTGGATGGTTGGTTGGNSTAGASASHISATTIAVIGGVAVAAVVGGLALAGKLPGKTSPQTSTSPPGLLSQ